MYVLYAVRGDALYDTRKPDSLPPVRVRAEYLGAYRLKSFLTALSTSMSINYTARAVCPSLREPFRAEWRVNLF
jgi:hypothetical protein